VALLCPRAFAPTLCTRFEG